MKHSESVPSITGAEIGQRIVDAREKLRAMRDNQPRFEYELAFAYLEDPGVVLTFGQIEMVLAGLDHVVAVCEGRLKHGDYLDANARLALLSASADPDERQRLANGVDYALSQFAKWQSANPALVEFLKVPKNGEHE